MTIRKTEMKTGNIWKHLASFCLLIAALIFLPSELYAQSPYATLESGTKLVISGEGEAASSLISSTLDKSKVTEIVVENGITALGARIFRGFTAVETVSLPNSLLTIGEEAFAGCSSLGTITVPSSVTQIGNFAFARCSNLYNVGLTRNLQQIGSFAFSDCTALSTLTIPASVTSIGDNIFSGCQNLKSIGVGYGSTAFSEKGKALYNYEETRLIAFPKKLLSYEEVYCVPDGTTTIGKYAFSGNTALKDVVLPDGVTSLESLAFSSCSSLTGISIPESVTSIGSNCFAACPNLTIYGVRGSFAESYAKSIIITLSLLEEPVLEFSRESIDVSVIAMPTYDQQVAAAQSVTITNRSARYYYVRAEVYGGDSPADYQYAPFWPYSSAVTLGKDEGINPEIKPREERCGTYTSYSLHVYVNGELYRVLPITITFEHIAYKQGNAVEATCTANGRREYYKCSVCGSSYWDEECTQYAGSNPDTVIPALGHNYQDTVTDPTCTEGGVITHTCTRCGDITTEPDGRDPLGHTPVEMPAVEPTCGTPGYSAWSKCSVCEEILEQRKETAPATGQHTYNWTVVSEATCTAQGLKHFECTVCGTEGNETIEKLPHSFTNYVSNNNATCTEDGTETAKCDYCDAVDTRTVVGSHGHIPETITVSEPTCGSPAYYWERCARCGAELESPVITAPATGQHDYEITIISPATCTGWGAEHYKCRVCGDEGDSNIEPLQHSFTNYVFNNNATCTEDGTETAKCDHCDAVDTRTAVNTRKGHTEEIIPAVAAKCSSPGFTAGKRCSECGLILAEPKEIPATEQHVYGDWVIVQEASCITSGMQRRECTICSSSESRTIDAAGHHYSKVTFEWKEDRNNGIPNIYENMPWYSWTASGKCICDVCGHVENLPTTTKAYTPAEQGGQKGKIIFLAYAYLNDSYQTDQKVIALQAIPEPTLAPEEGDQNEQPDDSDKDDAAAAEAAAEEAAGHKTVEAATKTMAALSDNADPANSDYATLALKVKKVTNKSIKLQWNKVKDAAGYIIYANQCGKKNKYQQVADIKGASKTTFTLKKIQSGTLKKNTYYKVIVAAYKTTKGGEQRVIGTSKSIHAATSGGKNGNPVKLSVKKSVIVKVKKSVMLKAAQKAKAGTTIKKHRKLQFESSNPKIATVSKKDVLKGKKKGKCIVYVYAQNGLSAKVTVTVK